MPHKMPDNSVELASLVRKGDPDRYLTALFAARPQRPALLALYAFNVETARVADLVSDPLVGQIRLQWWREALAGLAAGDKPRAHPIVEALAPLVADGRLAVPPLIALLDAREVELESTPFHTMAGLEAYATATGGTLMRAAAHLLAPDEPGDAATTAGTAHALTGILRNLPHHLAQGRLLLPQDAFQATGLTPDDLFMSRNLDKLAQALTPVYQRAVHLMAAAGRPSALARPALLPLALAQSDLRAFRRVDFDPFSPAMRRERPGRLLRLMWSGLTGCF